MDCNGKMSDCPVFVVGMPRSGTTLLSAMLNSHPEISIAPETHFLSEWMRKYRGIDLRRNEDFERFWANFSQSDYFNRLGILPDSALRYIRSLEEHDYGDVFRAILYLYGAKYGKKRWGEKTPTHYFHVDCLLSWYPSAKIVWMLRDSRAVVASRLKMPWPARSVEDIAFQWRNSVRLMHEYLRDRKIYVAKYENLVLDPESELSSLCDYLGEEYVPSMLHYFENADELINEEPWKLNVSKPLEKEHLETWRHDLTSAQISRIEHITKREMGQNGFRPVETPLDLFQAFKISAGNHARRLKRLFTGKPYLSEDIR